MNIVNAGSRYQVYGEDVRTFKTLPATTYTIGYHPQMGFWLIQHSDLTTNEEVIYGNQNRRAEKILKSYALSERNFGVILSGKKGIGKSLLARMIAEKAIERNMPVIIVDTAIPGISNFLSSIEQEVVIIFDEFEKVFAKNDDGDPQVEMLSLFDGIDNGKKLFVITCNNTNELNEFLINRPGRFHYHFEITCPSAEEITAYMRDKIGLGYEQEIEKIIKLSQMADITYDVLRAVAFDLAQGYSLEETLGDLNINYERESCFDATVRLSNGWIASCYSHRVSLYEKRDTYMVFFSKGGRFYLHYNPQDIVLRNGVLTIAPEKCRLKCDWEMFDQDCPNEEEAEEARKKFNTEVKVESVTLTKVANYGVNKYVDV